MPPTPHPHSRGFVVVYIKACLQHHTLTVENLSWSILRPHASNTTPSHQRICHGLYSGLPPTPHPRSRGFVVVYIKACLHQTPHKHSRNCRGLYQGLTSPYNFSTAEVGSTAEKLSRFISRPAFTRPHFHSRRIVIIYYSGLLSPPPPPPPTVDEL